MKREPIYSITQSVLIKDGTAPQNFLIRNHSEIKEIKSELHWRLIDFARIHQIVYKEVDSIGKKLNEIEISPFTENLDDEENIQISRKLDYVMGVDEQNDRVISFVDQLSVVGLWAIAEQFLGKIYTAFKAKKYRVVPTNVKVPYKWDTFKSEFRQLGIDVTTCDNFANADECRVLNNAIKHDPIVSSILAQYSYFVPFKGQELEKVPLDMQRYYNGVSDFIGSLLAKIDDELL